MIARLRQRLLRITSSGRFIPEIDGLRFFAIGAVLLFHVNGYYRDKCGRTFDPPLEQDPLYLLFNLGNIGVQLFFVLSGFILALPFAEHHLLGAPKVPLKGYYYRRLTRLEPPYIVNLLLLFSARVLLAGTALGLLPHLLASLFYVHSLTYGTWSRINFVAWSLEIEVQFYLLAPLLAWLFAIPGRRLRRMVIGLLAALFMIWQHHRLKAEFPHGLLLFDQIQFFLAGFVLADVYLIDWQRQPTRSFGWDLTGVLAWGGVLATLIFARPAGRFIVPVLLLVAYMAAFRGVLWNRLVRAPFLVVIGGMCYSIYLYHAFIILVLLAFTRHLQIGSRYGPNVLLQTLLLVPPVLLASAVLFSWLERPFMRRDWPARLRNRFLHRPPSPPPTSF